MGGGGGVGRGGYVALLAILTGDLIVIKRYIISITSYLWYH